MRRSARAHAFSGGFTLRHISHLAAVGALTTVAVLTLPTIADYLAYDISKLELSTSDVRPGSLTIVAGRWFGRALTPSSGTPSRRRARLWNSPRRARTKNNRRPFRGRRRYALFDVGVGPRHARLRRVRAQQRSPCVHDSITGSPPSEKALAADTSMYCSPPHFPSAGRHPRHIARWETPHRSLEPAPVRCAVGVRCGCEASNTTIIAETLFGCNNFSSQRRLHPVSRPVRRVRSSH